MYTNRNNKIHRKQFIHLKNRIPKSPDPKRYSRVIKRSRMHLITKNIRAHINIFCKQNLIKCHTCKFRSLKSSSDEFSAKPICKKGTSTGFSLSGSKKKVGKAEPSLKK